MKRTAALIGSSLALLAVGVSQPAHASVWCTATISQLVLEPGGAVAVVFTDTSTNTAWGGWWCSVTGSTNGNNGLGAYTVTSDTCRALYSTLLTARMANRPVSILYYGSPTTCATVPNGQLPGQMQL